MSDPRPVDRRRWRRRIAAQLDDSARQLGVLAVAMGRFGPEFDPVAFAEAYESEELDLYERAKLLEGALTSVQGLVVQLSEDGARLAQLELRAHRRGEPRIAPTLEALAAVGVIARDAAKRLTDVQRVRNQVEHAYIDLPAKTVHRAVADLAQLAPEFLDGYGRWIAPYLEPERER